MRAMLRHGDCQYCNGLVSVDRSKRQAVQSEEKRDFRADFQIKTQAARFRRMQSSVCTLNLIEKRK